MTPIITAKHRNVRMSPRKIRLVAEAIKGMSVIDSESQLQNTNKRATGELLKLIKSATANAKNVYNLEKDQLVVTRISTNQGPTIKRFTPRAFGRATPIRKRTTHLLVELGLAEGVSQDSIKKIEHEGIGAPTSVTDTQQTVKKEETHKQGEEELSEKGKKENGDVREDMTPKRTFEEKSTPKKVNKKSFVQKIFNRKVG